MTESMTDRYDRSLKRYVTALRNEKPDMVPIRPFVAEFTARYAGMTSQQVTQDYDLAFEAARKCAADYDWDAIVPNMVYVWSGLTQAAGLKYYGVPGVELDADTGFQYREPAEDEAWMKPDEYDALIDDPTAFLYNVWFPRVSADVAAPGSPATYRSALAFVKTSMAMMSYFTAFGPAIDRLRDECGTASAIAGILKAPFDIIADKLRGYIGLTMDMQTQPEKVLRACEALMPHLYNLALGSSDPSGTVPIGFWMHRGCVPFVTPDQFDSHYWPTLKPIIEELWRNGRQTLFYAEGSWDYHLDTFATLPERSIVYHVDRGDIFKAHEKLGDRFCLSGGIPNTTLSFGTPDQVREICGKVIDGVAGDGGYIMDASAIMQDDTDPENLRVLTEFTREHGVYSSGSIMSTEPPGKPHDLDKPSVMGDRGGVCIPWDEKKSEFERIAGDEGVVRRVWENVDALGSMFIWQMLCSF